MKKREVESEEKKASKRKSNTIQYIFRRNAKDSAPLLHSDLRGSQLEVLIF